MSAYGAPCIRQANQWICSSALIGGPIRKIAPLRLVTSGLTDARTGAPLQMRSGPVSMRSRTLMATSQSRALRPESEPPHRGPPGAVILQKRQGQHTASIERTLANQSQSPRSLLIGSNWQTGRPRPWIQARHLLLVSKLLSLVLTRALVFWVLVDKEDRRLT